jgi:hypothetical protein
MSSGGGTKGFSWASAVRRAARASRASYWARFSRSDETKRVGSTFSSSWPATCSPSRTRISETMPPSRLCITCTWRDGMTLPSPRVTSSRGEGGPHDQGQHGRAGEQHRDAAAAQLLLGHRPFGVGEVVGVVVDLALLDTVEDAVEATEARW